MSSSNKPQSETGGEQSQPTKATCLTWNLPAVVGRRCVDFACGLSLRAHLVISIALRLALIYYGQWQDDVSELPYTDIDYKVVTDGARHILHGESPFERHAYRYSPLLAVIQLPNVLWHPICGKLIYASFDLFVALLIHAFVRNELRSQCRKAVQSFLSRFGKMRSQSQQYNETDERNRPERIALASACFWLYNPLTAVISTRGNGDSFSSFFVILTLYALARAEDTTSTRRCQSYWLIFAAGIAHGIAIHLRLYPLLFSLAYYLCLSESLTRTVADFLRQVLFPSVKQLLLVLGTLVGLCAVSGYFYHLYGWQYLHEAYFYHFVRTDVRHNFSLYFLMQYLGERATVDSLGPAARLLVLTPQLLLLLYLSFSFGQFRQTLPFCVFAMVFVMVTFNTVVTSQYFVWYLALLPLCLNNLQSLSLRKVTGLLLVWLLAQGFWLLPAYLLEFKTMNTFYWIGGQAVLFFLVNNLVLACLIQHYSFTSFKVNFKKLF